MTIGDRLRELRKTLGLNQNDVAVKLQVGQAHVSAMEKGIREITDRTIADLCREYNVSELWLRYGEGDMFREIPDSILDELIAEYGLDPMDKILINEYLQLDRTQKRAIKAYVSSVLGQTYELGKELAEKRNSQKAAKTVHEHTAAPDAESVAYNQEYGEVEEHYFGVNA